MNEEHYYTLKELCRVYNRSEKSVRTLVRERRIPYGKFGRTLLFPQSMVESWLRYPDEVLADWWNKSNLPGKNSGRQEFYPRNGG